MSTTNTDKKKDIKSTQKDHISDIVKRVESKYVILKRLLKESHTHHMYVTKDGETFKATYRDICNNLDEDIKLLKSIPDTFKTITTNIRSANRSTGNSKNGLNIPKMYSKNVADFFFDRYLTSPELESILTKEEFEEIPNKLPYLLEHNITSPTILSQLFYGYRLCIPGVIVDENRSFIRSDKGISEYFANELDLVIKNNHYPDFDISQFKMNRIATVFAYSKIDEDKPIHETLGITQDQLMDDMTSEMEYLQGIREKVKKHFEKKE